MSANLIGDIASANLVGVYLYSGQFIYYGEKEMKKYTKEILEDAVKNSRSVAGVLKLILPPGKSLGGRKP